MSAITAYPLSWPAGWKRATVRQDAKFHGTTREYSSQPGGGSWLRKRTLSIAEGTERVLAELTRLGCSRDDIVISTNLQLRMDGLPRSNQSEPGDPGVAVYWQSGRKEPKVMAIDHYDRVADNLAAIAASLAALRAIERHGGAAILDRAFTGFTALPAPGQTTARGWREVLAVDAGERDLSKVQDKYRRLCAVHHPDRGGTQDAMAELNWAWAQAQQTLQP